MIMGINLKNKGKISINYFCYYNKSTVLSSSEFKILKKFDIIM